MNSATDHPFRQATIGRPAAPGSALTDAGGTVGVNLGGFHGEFACGNSACSGAGLPARLLTSGAVTTAELPLPGTLPLVGLALGVLGAVRRRR